jgi:hypothetical protein
VAACAAVAQELSNITPNCPELRPENFGKKLKNVISGKFRTKLRWDQRLEFIKESDGIIFCCELPCRHHRTTKYPLAHEGAIYRKNQQIDCVYESSSLLEPLKVTVSCFFYAVVLK